VPDVRPDRPGPGPRHLLRAYLPPTRLPTPSPSANQPTLTQLINHLRQAQRLIDQTVYECPACNERFLGHRRCGDCNLMCRKVGLGGECASCAEILTIADLLGADLEGGALL